MPHHQRWHQRGNVGTLQKKGGFRVYKKRATKDAEKDQKDAPTFRKGQKCVQNAF